MLPVPSPDARLNLTWRH